MIHRNPDSLKDAGQRFREEPPADRGFNGTGKLPRCRDRTARHHGAGDSPGRRFFSVLTQDLSQARHIQPVQNPQRTLSSPRVEPHIERGVTAEAEPARDVVELVRRNAQIQQQSVYPGDTEAGNRIVESSEVGLNKRNALTVTPQALSRKGECLRIGIDADQPPLPPQHITDLPRMSPAARRAVDIGSLGIPHQVRDGLCAEDGIMEPLGCHVRSQPGRVTVPENATSEARSGQRSRTNPPVTRHTPCTSSDSRVRSARGRRESQLRFRCPQTAGDLWE